jgi:hypothetical protein
MTNIEPTFSCFDDAIELLGQFVREDRQPTLVHGLLESISGERYAHAWVEASGLAWDSGILNGQRVAYAVQQFDFYTLRRVKRTWRYTLADMLRENRRTGTYGPWTPELQGLCSDKPRILGSHPAIYIPRGG